MNVDQILSAVPAAASLASLLAASVAGYASMAMRLELAKLRQEIAEARARDKDEIRGYLNGSFMRASTVQAELDSVRERVNDCLHACPAKGIR